MSRVGISLLVLACVTGCMRPKASRAQCARILERIIEIELFEQGYRDPELLARKTRQLRQRFAADVEACIGRRMPTDAMECIERAQDTETLTHDCLRR